MKLEITSGSKSTWILFRVVGWLSFEAIDYSIFLDSRSTPWIFLIQDSLGSSSPHITPEIKIKGKKTTVWALPTRLVLITYDPHSSMELGPLAQDCPRRTGGGV